MQCFPCRGLRRPTSFSASECRKRSDEMSRRAWTTYCQKVATPRIDWPLSIMPIMHNVDHCAEDMEPARPRRADENRSEGVEEVGIVDILWSACAPGR